MINYTHTYSYLYIYVMQVWKYANSRWKRYRNKLYELNIIILWSDISQTRVWRSNNKYNYYYLSVAEFLGPTSRVACIMIYTTILCSVQVVCNRIHCAYIHCIILYYLLFVKILYFIYRAVSPNLLSRALLLRYTIWYTHGAVCQLSRRPEKIIIVIFFPNFLCPQERPPPSLTSVSDVCTVENIK